ncbi:hypothetical protein [Enterococcus sp. AZ196]|uniref:hypothetical protein n=1 Tax=Enterococcus sp. AZ196 TaxID=2774659 RepID=UPI003D28602C
MTKLCFVFTVDSGTGYGPLAPPVNSSEYSDMKKYFSTYYDVSFNYLRDKDTVDYLIVPDPFFSFDNENNLPIIKVPAKLLMTKDFAAIKASIDNYFSQLKQ